MTPSRPIGLLLIAAAALAPGCGERGAAPEERPRSIEVVSPSEEMPARGPARLEPGARGGTVVFARPTGPRTLNWVAGTDSDTLIVAHLVSDSLVFNDADLDLVPKLALGWSWSEDRRTLRFRMRRDARWEDGVAVTSDDVLYTYEAIQDPDSGADNLRAQFGLVESVEAPDPWTVVVRYREPFAPAVSGWNIPLLPAHRYREQEDFRDNPLARRPLSCGPWRLVSWEAGREIVLEPNPDYYLGPPGPDRLVIRVIREFSTRYQALERGELSVETLTPILRRRALEDERLLERYRLESYFVVFLFYIAWNGDGTNPFLDDPRVRRAMTLALDRQGYADGPFFGQARVATTSFHPAQWAYDASLEPWPFDPDAARRLLAAAGFADADGDGVLDRDGTAFRFPLLYPAEIEENRRLGAWIRDSLAEVGVAVDLEPLAWPLLMDRLGRRDFAAATLGFRTDVDPDPYQLWHSSQIEGGLNRVGYADAEMDRLLERGRTSLERAERTRIYRQVQGLLHRDQPYTFLFYPASTLAVSRSLRDVGTSPRGAFLFWPGPSAWWLEPAPERP